MRKEVQIIGPQIYNLDDFHREISQLLSFPHYYGNNLDDLLDCLTSYIDPNTTINWLSHDASKRQMGHDFDRVIEVFQTAKSYRSEFEFFLN
ncbi:MAG: hypothetical protein BM556_01255 [Bacteriovorax sp. MedPE-SWde]|nr:MAG: hypothetical protein BM556_01255 [Bacteriovorax sp. MedPE-SWde]